MKIIDKPIIHKFYESTGNTGSCTELIDYDDAKEYHEAKMQQAMRIIRKLRKRIYELTKKTPLTDEELHEACERIFGENY